MTAIIVGVLVVAIWIFIEIKRMKHKLFAILLIALILFSYISFAVTIKGEDIDLMSVDGIMTASQLYFSWLGSVFVNLKSITTYAIGMDWQGNQTNEK